LKSYSATAFAGEEITLIARGASARGELIVVRTLDDRSDLPCFLTKPNPQDCKINFRIANSIYRLALTATIDLLTAMGGMWFQLDDEPVPSVGVPLVGMFFLLSLLKCHIKNF
jgi:hypothetical protein